MVAPKGNVYNYSGATWYGSLAGSNLPAPVVDIATTTSGYLLATAKGNVYNVNTHWALPLWARLRTTSRSWGESVWVGPGPVCRSGQEPTLRERKAAVLTLLEHLAVQ